METATKTETITLPLGKRVKVGCFEGFETLALTAFTNGNACLEFLGSGGNRFEFCLPKDSPCLVRGFWVVWVDRQLNDAIITLTKAEETT
jgi:hypothetical protein